MRTYTDVYQSEELDVCISSLLYSQLCKRYDLELPNIDISLIRKSGWLASILSESPEELHRQKAQTFAILLHLFGNDNIVYDKLSYIILSRLGNLAVTRLFSSLNAKDSSSNDINYEFGNAINLEMFYDRLKRTVVFNDTHILTTDFQLNLLKSLESNNNVSISAPTSSGKSFVLQLFIKEHLRTSDGFHCLYIVPTKAMLSEVSNDLRHTFEGASIRTAYLDGEIIESDTGEQLTTSIVSDKIIYVLTPERCLKLLEHSESKTFNPTIVFADEIQNVEEESGRGILFEYVYEQVVKRFYNARYISAGPFINEPQILFNNVFGLDCIANKTIISPVLQVKTTVRNPLNLKELVIESKETKSKSNAVVTIPVDFNLNTELRKNKGSGIAKVIHSLGNIGQSIVYCPRSDYAEDWCLKYAQLFNTDVTSSDISDNVNELIEYLTEEIHQKYFLITCLQSRAAFHHSKLPDIVRSEIESCFKSGLIGTLYCTSTLLQGVNLPANNLFVTSPYKRNIRLSPFEFGNLIGRAGRIKDSLYGTIYCIEDEDSEKRWADAYYDISYEREVDTATSKCLKRIDSIIENISLNANDIKESSVGNTIVYLRHRYLENTSDDFKDYLVKKNVPDSHINELSQLLLITTSEIRVPSDILKLNPTIDPLLQDMLYKTILTDGIDKWVVHINSNFYKRIGKDFLDGYQYEEYSFYWQLATICVRLDSIFSISRETYFKQDISLSIKSIAYFAFRWLQSRTLKEIIDDTLVFESTKIKSIDITNSDDINASINRVINIHTKVVTYLLVRYFKLLSDILRFMLDDEQAEKFKFSLSLPIMLELGTTEPLAIKLMSAGITRSVALAVVKVYKAKHIDEEILVWLKSPQCTGALKPIYVRYLEHNKYI